MKQDIDSSDIWMFVFVSICIGIPLVLSFLDSLDDKDKDDEI